MSFVNVYLKYEYFTSYGSCRTIEEQKLKQVNREVKRARTNDGNSSKGKFEVQGKPRFKKRFSNQGSSSTLRVNKDRVSNPNPQGGNSGSSYVDRPNCAKCGKKHEGKYLVGTDGCFSCGKRCHSKRDCPMLKVQGREVKQVPPSGSNSDAPKNNNLYALQSRGDQESSPNVVGMLQVFSIDVYALLDPGATLSFVTPFVAMKFEMLPEEFLEPFSMSTPVGDSDSIKEQGQGQARDSRNNLYPPISCGNQAKVPVIETYYFFQVKLRLTIP
uniref:Gag-pol polyprotein n=1 Tax=Solanum tuberosum TaxID=4113 RepID=M1DX31_SOLTU